MTVTISLLKLMPLLLIVGVSSADESTSSTSSSTTTTLQSTPLAVYATSSTVAAGPIITPSSLEAQSNSDKIARRIIDDRLSPPRATDFAPWNTRLPIGEVHRVNLQPPKVTEDIDDNATERALPKKTRTVGPAQEAGCCGNGKSSLPNSFVENKERSSSTSSSSSSANDALEVVDLERSNVNIGNGGSNGGSATASASASSSNGPAARFHGNRPSDDRYGWRSSSYLGYGKDKGYYDQRNHYPYDRYSSSSRPSSNYALDSDRYSGLQRPSSSNYGSSDSSDRFGSSGSSSNVRPGNNYPSSNYGYGGSGSYNDNSRPLLRPGVGNYGISGNIAGETDSDYPFAEGGPPPGAANLQTQKAVALKALAGVALIGAAAALASNPVLLPLSVISGRRRRRRRSVQLESDNYALTALLQGYIQPKPNEVAHGEHESIKSVTREDRKSSNSSSEDEANVETTVVGGRQELVISPECVARLACHVHRDYLDELEKSKAAMMTASLADGDKDSDDNDTAFRGLEHWFDSLIHSNILVADYLSDELKSLIQSAVAVGSNRNATCDKFSCLNVNSSSDKKTL